MDIGQKALRVAVVWGAGIGPAAFRKLMTAFGSTADIIGAAGGSLREVHGRLDDETIAAIRSAGDRVDEYLRLVEDLEQTGVTVAIPGEPEYPEAFVALRHTPPVVCIRGKVIPEDRRAVAMVGSREAGREDCERAAKIARMCVQAGLTVVSGLAIGIDTASHHGAVLASGRTLAVLGSGIRNIYPHRNMKLAARIEQSGAVISEQPPDADPSVGTLMARNRLIACLGAGTIVVSSGISGGSLVTARHTREQGKPVAAIDRDESDTKRAGNLQLIADGAVPLHTDDDVEDFVRSLEPVEPVPYTATQQEPDDQMQLF